jgi:hypothetical protein
LIRFTLNNIRSNINIWKRSVRSKLGYFLKFIRNVCFFRYEKNVRHFPCLRCVHRYLFEWWRHHREWHINMISVGEKQTNMYRLQLVIWNKIDNIDKHHRRKDSFFLSQDSVKKKWFVQPGRIAPIFNFECFGIYICFFFVLSNRIKSINHYISKMKIHYECQTYIHRLWGETCNMMKLQAVQNKTNIFN